MSENPPWCDAARESTSAPGEALSCKFAGARVALFVSSVSTTAPTHTLRTSLVTMAASSCAQCGRVASTVRGAFRLIMASMQLRKKSDVVIFKLFRNQFSDNFSRNSEHRKTPKK
jgi:hypothetical protein